MTRSLGKKKKANLTFIASLFYFGYRFSTVPFHVLYKEVPDAHNFLCPVKVFVHDLGFRAKSGSFKKGFNSTVNHGESISYYTALFASWEHPWFILQKFLYHSSCSVIEVRDADFILLPLPDMNSGELDRIVQLLERDHNTTLFRRGMKDHIIPGIQNTRKGYQMARRLSNRTHELTTPMIKFLVDIWGWWYHFSAYKHYTTREQIFFYYDRVMTVPYASNMFHFTGDVEAKRPYLASFLGNSDYPAYRRNISDQCQHAMDCIVGGDTGPRKALFDGLAANSIPIVFDETSFDITYPVYFPNPRDYSIFLNSTVNIMDQLRTIPPSRIAELQSNIASIRDSITYLSGRNEKDATWMILNQLKEYKSNGYKFPDHWENRTGYRCIEKKCRFM